MSVTFSIEGAQQIQIKCPRCASLGSRCMRECDGTSLATTAPEVNFANTNARALLEALGIDADDLYGTMAPQLMLARINNARVSDLDMLDRLNRLREVVVFAIHNDHTPIVWG